MKILTAARKLHSYCPETGEFIRLKDTKIIFSNKVIKAGTTSGRLRHEYIVIDVLGKTYMAHRLAWLYMTGNWPAHQIDHINGIKTDNRWCNLRECTNSENQMNTKSKTGLKNIRRAGNKYWVTVRSQKGVYSEGFSTLDEAKAAAFKARNSLHGQFARHE